jgi:hypothetical protein
VRQQIDATMDTLLQYVRKFQDAIVGSLAKLPFGLRYICKCLRLDLHEKFPDVAEVDILKVCVDFFLLGWLKV